MGTNYRHKNVTVSIREDLLQAAKSFGLNTSQAAEQGLLDAVNNASRNAWLAENKDAIASYNAHVEKNGVAFPPLWEAE